MFISPCYCDSLCLLLCKVNGLPGNRKHQDPVQRMEGTQGPVLRHPPGVQTPSRNLRNIQWVPLEPAGTASPISVSHQTKSPDQITTYPASLHTAVNFSDCLVSLAQMFLCSLSSCSTCGQRSVPPLQPRASMSNRLSIPQVTNMYKVCQQWDVCSWT